GKLLAKRLYSGDNTCCRHDSLQRSEPGYLKRDAKTLYVQILPVLMSHTHEEDARRFCSWNGGDGRNHTPDGTGEAPAHSRRRWRARSGPAGTAGSGTRLLRTPRGGPQRHRRSAAPVALSGRVQPVV